MPVTELTFTEHTFVVIHDDNGLVHYLDCEADTALGTGQPHIEQFTDEAEAKARAEELGYVFPDPETDPFAPPAPELP